MDLYKSKKCLCCLKVLGEPTDAIITADLKQFLVEVLRLECETLCIVDENGICPDCFPKLQSSYSLLSIIKNSLNYIKTKSVEVQEKTINETHKCKECDRSFSSKRGLAAHKIFHNNKDETTYNCIYCDTSFSSKLFYLNHMKTHSDFICIFCNHGFVDEIFLLQHIQRTHPIPRQFHCNFCGKTCFKSKKVFYNHLRTVHKIKATTEIFFCWSCTPKSNNKQHGFTKAGLLNHFEQNHRNSKVNPIGTPTIITDDNYENFLEEALNNPEIMKYSQMEGNDIEKLEKTTNNFKIELLPSDNGEIKIRWHDTIKKDQKTDNTRKEYEMFPNLKCPKCTSDHTEVKFKKIADLHLHLAQIHGDYSLTCTECGLKFQSKEKLKLHRKDHIKDYNELIGEEMPDVEENFKHIDKPSPVKLIPDPKTDMICLLCDKTFQSLSGLKYHFKSFHSFDDVTFHCPYDPCTKVFKANTNLISHIRHLHAERTINCNLCEKKFTNTSELKRHEKRHSSEKFFSCPTCNKSFYQSSHLSQHKKTHLRRKS